MSTLSRKTHYILNHFKVNIIKRTTPKQFTVEKKKHGSLTKLRNNSEPRAMEGLIYLIPNTDVRCPSQLAVNTNAKNTV